MVVFIIEALIKIIALGFYNGPRAYIRDGYNVLDFFIVVLTLINKTLETVLNQDISFINAFRTMRALRPLKLLSRNQGIPNILMPLL